MEIKKHAYVGQGDQMGLYKNLPKYRPTHFLSKIMHNLYRGKK
jgi:hypothetical protein